MSVHLLKQHMSHVAGPEVDPGDRRLVTFLYATRVEVLVFPQ